MGGELRLLILLAATIVGCSSSHGGKSAVSDPCCSVERDGEADVGVANEVNDEPDACCRALDGGNVVPPTTDLTAPVSLSVGVAHTCALFADGTAKCWGANRRGQLGFGHTDNVGDDETPATAGSVQIGATLLQLVAGDQITCGLLSSQDVRCWGSNGYGQLGVPGPEVGVESASTLMLGDITGVAVGSGYACAVTEAGAVRCWGINRWGQLGYANAIGCNEGDGFDCSYDGVDCCIEDATESQLVDIGEPVANLAVGGGHACALTVAGNVRCWGANAGGQLGYAHTDTIGDDEHPSSQGTVDLGGALARQVSVGIGHTCALVDDGRVMCWGVNLDGRLGYGHTETVGDDETPASVGYLDMDGLRVSELALGNEHTCALTEDGDVYCWGTNPFGLGYGNVESIGDDELPTSVGPVPIGGTAEHIYSRNLHTCALLKSGEVKCWGGNSAGQLGYGHTDNIGDDETPATVGYVELN